MRIIILCLSLLLAIINCDAQRISETYPDSLNKKKLYRTIGTEVVSYAAGLSFLRYIWYTDHERVPFHFYNDSKGYLQIDKWGHGYSAYRESYLAYNALRRTGLSKKKALLIGGPVGLLFQTPIEIFDGMYEDWGFSWYDMAANTFGSLLFTVQEALWDDQIVLMKFSYSPSIYPEYSSYLGTTQVERFFYDYNAHSYWLSANVSKITKSKKIPSWLNVALGYSANGMIYEFYNPVLYHEGDYITLERHRQFLISLDVDFTKIPTNKKWLKKIFQVVNLIKVPFPTLEYNRVDGLKGRLLYF
ncbi:MAG: DUF2279 domain-containing protein [Flavobacteriales bacterium]|nr:DUF2279 domain-containing protein [Flavobacteriales bacterium]